MKNYECSEDGRSDEEREQQYRTVSNMYDDSISEGSSNSHVIATEHVQKPIHRMERQNISDQNLRQNDGTRHSVPKRGVSNCLSSFCVLRDRLLPQKFSFFNTRTIFWNVNNFATIILVFFIVIAGILSNVGASKLLAKFEIDSVSAHSIVVKMIPTDYGNALDSDNKNNNNNRHPTTNRMPLTTQTQNRKLEMKITIFDLDRLREFRHSELTATVKLNSQLFSFDGLLSDTWFAIRINYRILYYDNTDENNEDYGGGSLLDFPTKQELIVKTKAENVSPSSSLTNSRHKFIEEEHVIRFESIDTAPNQLNLTLSSIFTPRSRLVTLVVPELRCLRGTIKPAAQRIRKPTITVSFDLQKLASIGSSSPAITPRKIGTNEKAHKHQKNNHRRHYYSTKAASDPLDAFASSGVDLEQLNSLQCYQLCIFPFVRAEIANYGEQTFRAKEFCDSIPNASRLVYYFSKYEDKDEDPAQPRQQRLRSADNRAQLRGENDVYSKDQSSSKDINRVNILLIISTFIILL